MPTSWARRWPTAFRRRPSACPSADGTHESRRSCARRLEKPADLQGAAFEAGLVDRCRTHAGTEPGNLPLLEFALTCCGSIRILAGERHAVYDLHRLPTRPGQLCRPSVREPGSERARARPGAPAAIGQPARTEDIGGSIEDESGDENWEVVQRLADRRLWLTDRMLPDEMPRWCTRL